MNPDDRAELESLAKDWRQIAAHLEQGTHSGDPGAAGAYYTAAADLIQKLRGMAR